jgi:hypothetical protein
VKNFLAGKDVSIDVLFEQGADTVIPDTGSTKYTLYDNNGAAMSGSVDVPLTVTSTQVAIDILAIKNAKTLPFETRTLVVTYKVNGGTRTQTVQYRLIDMIPMSVNEDSVRSLIGMSRVELPNKDIDLYMAYVGVCEDVDKAVVDAALVAGDSTQLAVNRMLVCRSLMEVLPGIQLRVIQESKSNTAQLSRFSKIDFDALTSWIQDLYYVALLILVPDPTGGSNAPMILVTTPSPDPITGT